MSALTKAEMAEQLFEELGLNKREAKEIVEAFFEEIRLSLESNEQVKISGFGNFDLRDKRSRPGRNPKTGAKAKGASRDLCRTRQRLLIFQSFRVNGISPLVKLAFSVRLSRMCCVTGNKSSRSFLQSSGEVIGVIISVRMF